MTAEPHPQRCDDSCPCRTPVCEETCPEYQFQERFSIWLATHYDLPTVKHVDIVEGACLIFDDLCSPAPTKSEQEIRKDEREEVLDILNIELDEVKSRIESSAMGQPLSERSRGEIIGLLHAREKIKYLRSKQGGEQEDVK